MDNKLLLQQQFKASFNKVPECIVQAPGRVNLIGEHTDYNEGFVFPAAIDFGTWVAASKRDDNNVRVIALDYDNQENVFPLADIAFDNNQGWANYVRGVTTVLKASYPQIGGADLMVTGNVPQGAGLSSSASFEIAVLKAFKALYNLPLEGVEAAQLGQKAENTFVGCSCGIMDQLVSAMGKEGQAMLLDCRSLAFQYTSLPDDLAIVIINSNVKRGLVDSEYNLRRQQCEEAAQAMNLNSLREADLAMLESHRLNMSEVAYRRARHILTDNARTLQMFDALNSGDIKTVSEAMAASHISMRDDFEITVPPIDYLVEIISEVLADKGGVRMTGGGFGGCVVALVPKNMVLEVTKAVDKHYHARTGYKQSIYICSAERGAFA
ncbi:galactokinase [Alteromonas pelagimontana]|uniref:Galactokinase n=1 Tax=Alteromonas pelagimontana TaxID=1858656 RepID=A0A6M4MF83_9ALTE|nr:galactokinase [Alteromonas pelagimontana]QJR81275.1 galactokinase [Alteromonas pelagimontana]